MNKLKQLFCNHTFSLYICEDYLSESDERYKLPSAKISIHCKKCNKKMVVHDEYMKYINWLRQTKGM